MSWNYRILRHVDPAPSRMETLYPNGIIWYGIHEVYYDEQGTPHSCSVNEMELKGESAVDIAQDMKLMALAFDKPILEYSYFEEKGKEKRDATT